MQLCGLLSLLPLYLFVQAKDAAPYNHDVACSFAHVLKLILSLAVAALELVMLIWNFVLETDIDLAQVTINFLSVLTWLFVLRAVRVQYVSEQRTQRWLRVWWVLMLCVQSVVLPLQLVFSIGHRVLEDTSMEEVLLLVAELTLALVSCCYSHDVTSDEWSVHSNSILSTYSSVRNSHKMSEEEVWKSLEPLSGDTEVDNSTVHSVTVLSCIQDAAFQEVVSLTQFRIEIRRGHRGTFLSETRRTYAEFAALYKDYDSVKGQIPPLPEQLSTHVSGKQLDHRRHDFDHIIKLMVRNSPRNDPLSEFLRSNFLVPIYQTNSTLLHSFVSVDHTGIQAGFRPSSREMEEICRYADDVEVEIVSTNNSRARMKKYTVYVVETRVKSRGETFSSQHRFSEFKELVDKLRLRVQIRSPMPRSGMRTSSTDPETVRSRRQQLQTLLVELVSRPDTISHPAVLAFLHLPSP